MRTTRSTTGTRRMTGGLLVLRHSPSPPVSEATPLLPPRAKRPPSAPPPHLWYTSSTIGSAGSPARQYAFFPSYRDAGERRAVLTGSSRFPPGRNVPPRSHAGVAREGFLSFMSDPYTNHAGKA